MIICINTRKNIQFFIVYLFEALVNSPFIPKCTYFVVQKAPSSNFTSSNLSFYGAALLPFVRTVVDDDDQKYTCEQSAPKAQQDAIQKRPNHIHRAL